MTTKMGFFNNDGTPQNPPFLNLNGEKFYPDKNGTFNLDEMTKNYKDDGKYKYTCTMEQKQINKNIFRVKTEKFYNREKIINKLNENPEINPFECIKNLYSLERKPLEQEIMEDVFNIKRGDDGKYF
jgi:hypothetical protein